MILFNFHWPRWILLFGLIIWPALLYSQALSQDYVDSKELTIEWEPVEGSVGYEIDVYGLGESGYVRLGSYKLKSTQWSSNLNPGKYKFRIRGLDSRGVPGLWGEFIPFVVSVPPPTLITPMNGADIKTDQDENANVEFTWKPVKGATAYVVEVFPEKPDEAAVSRLEVQEPKSQISLAVGKKYRWHVYSIDIQKSAGDPVKKQFVFTLIGKKIEPPEIEKPENEFISKINWSKPAGAAQYSYVLMRKNLQGQWETIEKKNDYAKETLDINPKHKGGMYRLRVAAVGTLRPQSEFRSIDFPVYDGERTAQAIEQAKLRRAMERDRDHYLIASYLISSLNYTGDNKESGNRLQYTVLGGTGRLGYGFMPKHRWGWTAIVDMGGVNLKNKNFTFASAEIARVWRRYLGNSSQIRVFGGLFVRETPEAQSFSGDDLAVKNIQQLGPLLGFQFWTSFNYKYGLQVNGQANMPVLKLATPNGKEIVPNLSYQLGVMGSYKMRENLTGFAGLAYRLDKVSYQAKPYEGGTELNFANEGDVNTVSLTGTYLNLYAEWGF